MSVKLFLSHRLDALLDQLIQQMDANPIDPIDVRTILVPNGQIRSWLLLEIAKRKGIAMGLKVVEIDQLFPSSMLSSELFCLVYKALQTSQNSEILNYLDGKKKRLLELAIQLKSLFQKYGEYEPTLFQEGKGCWQTELLHQLFVEGPWRLPVQQTLKVNGPIICFGVDCLSPAYWEALFQAPSCALYLFSPCIDFWADLCTDREKKALVRKWKKKGAQKKIRDELDEYLQTGPELLANWGKLGRESLKFFDQYDLETEEAYPALEPDTLLKQIQYNLLTFQPGNPSQIDNSIQLMLCGSSKLQEIEALKEEILLLKIPFSEISVLAPDIEPYVPLIEYVFGNELPYRISGFDIAPQSSLRQGLIRILELSSGRWDVEKVVTLFETPAFYRKLGLDSEMLEEFRMWTTWAQIGWGIDSDHRGAVLKERFGDKSYVDESSWEKGLGFLLDRIVYYKEEEIHPDHFEKFLEPLLAIQNLKIEREKSPTEWAEFLEEITAQFLLIDVNSEADQAFQSFLQALLSDLRAFLDQAPIPSEVILHLLTQSCFGQIHASSLHAVRFAPFRDAALIPVKACFLIGMDEMSFPKVELSSSINLLKQKIPGATDIDRYCFLEAFFSATDFLRISYCHLSEDEGKPVGPSLVVSELLSITGDQISHVYQPTSRKKNKKNFIWPNFKRVQLPSETIAVSISDLRNLARHPWKFFLQKVHQIYYREELEESFALQKGKLVRTVLDTKSTALEKKLLPGPLNTAMQIEIEEKEKEYKELLKQWDIETFSLIFRENCLEKTREGADIVMPPLEIAVDQCIVQITGTIPQVSFKGIVSFNDDHIMGMLKIWPEALIAAISMDAPEVWMLKNGKNKQLERPYESLKAFLNYYFHCLEAPSPLLPDWADPIMRKGVVDLQDLLEKKGVYDDPIMSWILARAELPLGSEMCAEWSPILRETFNSLNQLYPVRGAK